MKPRTCKNCGKIIPIHSGFHFDKELNLIHDECNKIAFEVDIAITASNSYTGNQSVIGYPGVNSNVHKMSQISPSFPAY